MIVTNNKLSNENRINKREVAFTYLDKYKLQFVFPQLISSDPHMVLISS